MGLVASGQANQKDDALTKNEIDFLLRHISSSKFDGKDVLLLHDIVQKLQLKLNKTR